MSRLRGFTSKKVQETVSASDSFPNSRDAHSAADAEGGKADVQIAFDHFVYQGDNDSGA